MQKLLLGLVEHATDMGARVIALSTRHLCPRLMAPSTDWQVIREYYCPKSGDLLDVKAPTPWYPVIHDFEPDIDAFHTRWLGLEVPEHAA